MMLAFAIVQWGIVLPVQCYVVFRSWRNWQHSLRDQLETAETLRRSREQLHDFRVWAREQGCDLDGDEPPPTIQ